MYRLIAIAVLAFLAAGCAYQSNPKDYWGGLTSLSPGGNKTELSARANNSNLGNPERALAVFTLFANHIPPASSAAEIQSVLQQPAWVSKSILRRIDVVAGKIPVRFEAGESVFSLELFPTEAQPPHGGWVIYLRFSQELRESDVAALLAGRSVPAGAQLIEFALCFPTRRIEQFAKEGVHVFVP